MDIKYIRENKKEIEENIKNRHLNINLDEFLEIDEKRRELQLELDTLRSEKKKIKDKEQGTELKKKEKQLKNKEIDVIDKFDELMNQIPNLTHKDSPVGKTDKDNKELEKVGDIPKFDFKPKDHISLGKELDLIDFEKASLVSGAKFYFLKNQAVLLEQALINYVLNLLTDRGYTPIQTPDLATQNMIQKSGFNPRDDSDQIYNIKNTDLSLIATSEITIGGYHANDVLEEKQLPLKYIGISHCFRKEAGTYGQESKGLYRVHQFTKAEMYIICTPDKSEEMHQELLEIEKEIFKSLEIPYRVVDVCTGDLGAPAYRKYDLEAWMPMRNDYGEITSTSNCTDYQARRLNVRYVDNGKKQYVHTLNGTAVAISRALIAILENHQQADGSINIPKVLTPFMNGVTKISK